MASQKRVLTIIQEAGYEPIEGKGIIVKYAQENLSAKIAKFFRMEYYVLHLCKNEIVFVPFNTITAGLKSEVSLAIPYSKIQSVTLKEDFLNYIITVTTDNGVLNLTAQQKELSDFRSTAVLAYGGLDFSNWHKRNMDETLTALTSIHN